MVAYTASTRDCPRSLIPRPEPCRFIVYPNDSRARGSANPIEPPNPGWPNASSLSRTASRSATGRYRLSIALLNPSAQRVGTSSRASTDVAEQTAPITATWAASTSGAPPSASGRYMPARPRALVMPPTAPISAACAARLSDSPGTVMYPPELASINAWIEVGSVNAATYRLDTGSPGPGGSAGIVGATRSSCSSGSPIQKSSPSGPATSSRKYVPNVRPLTRRITSPTRTPERFLTSQRVDHELPVVEAAGRQGFPDGRQPRLVAQQVADQDAVLAVLGELRPVRRDRSIDIELDGIL